MSEKLDQVLILKDGDHTKYGIETHTMYKINGYMDNGVPFILKPQQDSDLVNRIEIPLDSCKIYKVRGIKIHVLRVNEYTRQAVKEGGVYEIDGLTIQGYPYINVVRDYPNWGTIHKCVIPLDDVEFIGAMS